VGLIVVAMYLIQALAGRTKPRSLAVTEKTDEQLRADLLKAIGSYLEQHYPDNPIHYDDFTDHVLARINTRADSGEAVADPVGHFCFTSSEKTDIGQVHPMHKDDDDVFPLFTHPRATAVDAIFNELISAAQYAYSSIDDEGKSEHEMVRLNAAVIAAIANREGEGNG
jgi:hypothetical protein